MTERLTAEEGIARNVRRRVSIAIADMRAACGLATDDPIEVQIRGEEFATYFTLGAQEDMWWITSKAIRFAHEPSLESNVFVVRSPARRWAENRGGIVGLCRVDFYEISRYLREELVDRDLHSK